MVKMGYRKRILILLGIALVCILVAWLFDVSYTNEISGCEAHYFSSTSYPYYNPFCPLLVTFEYGGIFVFALFISLLPLLFLKEAVYKSWRRFAVVALPIGVLFIAISPTSVGGDLGGFSSDLDREGAAILFSILFTFISYLLIIVKSVHTQRSGWRLAGRVFLIFIGIISALWALAFVVDALR